MQLTPQRVRQLVEISFVLEPLLNKKDCTTRYLDIPGKPLHDFVISGINTGAVIEEYAHSVLVEGKSQMSSHFPKAVEVSNAYRNKKFVNVGLLEFMFVTLKTRFDSPSLEIALNNYIPTLKNTTKEDVLNNLKGFRVAIKTSKNREKVNAAKNNYEYFKTANNLYELYMLVSERFPDPNSSGYQVAEQYLNGFTIISKYVLEIDESTGLIKSIENTYDKLHKEQPNMKVGILADLAASAIFLYLSYQDPNKYVIH